MAVGVPQTQAEREEMDVKYTGFAVPLYGEPFFCYFAHIKQLMEG